MYAKDKNENQVEKINNSFVNRLYDIIPNPRINYKKIGLKDIDYKLLMYNPDVELQVGLKMNGRIDKNKTDSLILKYLELSKLYSYKINSKLMNVRDTTPVGLAFKPQARQELLTKKWINDITNELSKIEPEHNIIIDKLIKFLYGMNKSFHVEILWLCYGKQIYENLKNNIILKNGKQNCRTKSLQCNDCGSWFTVNILNSKTCRCQECQYEFNKFRKREWKKNNKSRHSY